MNGARCQKRRGLEQFFASGEDRLVATARWWTAHGWWRHGSRLQTQLYVNRRTQELNAEVLSALPALHERGVRKISWVAPLEVDGFAEPRDVAMLDALGLGHLAPALPEFWPSGGPVWDALALLAFKDRQPGVLLAEGKNYPPELYSAGTQAGKSGTERALASRARIEAAIQSVQAELDAPVDPGRWLDPLDPARPGSSSLYQTANRIAHAVWLRRQSIDAWLCHLLFTDDLMHHPTSAADWKQALIAAEQKLGINAIEIPFVGHAFLPALDPDEVLADLRERPAQDPSARVT